jgi:Flp pilus assembly pilin Flp
MRHLRKSLFDFFNVEGGTAAIEYALIVMLVFLIVIGAIRLLGQSVLDMLYSRIVGAF